jgi:hypothetical protein
LQPPSTFFKIEKVYESDVLSVEKVGKTVIEKGIFRVSLVVIDHKVHCVEAEIPIEKGTGSEVSIL